MAARAPSDLFAVSTASEKLRTPVRSVNEHVGASSLLTGNAISEACALNLMEDVTAGRLEASQSAGEAFGVTADLKKSHQFDKDVIAVQVAVCMQIRHRTDESFPGAMEIARVCQEISANLNSDSFNFDDGRLQGVQALLQIIDGIEGVDESAVDHIQEVIGEVFGRKVATAALLGRLVVPQETLAHGNGLAAFNPAQPALAAALKSQDFELSETLESVPVVKFGAFKGHYEESAWVNRHGNLAKAPWLSSDYSEQLSRAARSSWESAEFALAYLYSLTVDKLSGIPPFNLADLASAEELFSNPASWLKGANEQREARLRIFVEDSYAIPADNLGLTLVLEAARPTLPVGFSASEIDLLVEAARFKNTALASVVAWSLKAWAAGADPLSQLRESLSSDPHEDRETLIQALVKAEDEFRSTVATYWSAAGGRLQRTHCRKAWSNFILDKVAPLRNDFGRISGVTRLNAAGLFAQIRGRVVRLSAEYNTAMDAANVRYQDRTAADSAITQIAESLLQVGSILERIASQEKRLRASFDVCPRDEMQGLLNEAPTDSGDQICSALLCAVVNEDCEENPLWLSAQVFLRVPDLIKYVVPELLCKMTDPSLRFSVANITDCRLATALLFDLPVAGGDFAATSGDLLEFLRELAIERERRDILSALFSTDVLGPHERTLLHRSALEVGESIFTALQELEEQWRTAEVLMLPEEILIRRIIDEARPLADSADKVNSLINGRLIESWLRSNIDFAAEATRNAILERIQCAYQISEEEGKIVETLFDQKDYRAAVARLHDEQLSPMASRGLATRETMWRSDAIKRFSEPRRLLASELCGNTSSQHELVAAWLDPTLDVVQRENMRKLLYTVLSGEADQSKSVALRRAIVRLTDLRDHRDRKTIIDSATLREYFQASGLNPTFLSQLADIRKIVLIAVPQDIINGTSAIDDLTRLLAAEPVGSLVVFLVPGLPLIRRDELCDGLRRRGLLAAIIDDVDMCRLCSATTRSEGPTFIALLEILLEQLPLSRVSPYSTQDGQHVRVETYVGRAAEAEDLALRGKYSRVFSGRKLGKSALLKYVARKYNKHLREICFTLFLSPLLVANPSIGSSAASLMKWLRDLVWGKKLMCQNSVHEIVFLRICTFSYSPIKRIACF
jgi:hypothetical protein